MRTLNKVAMTQPMSVTTCNLDLENLITDVNRSIATLAITTLLKVWVLTGCSKYYFEDNNYKNNDDDKVLK